MMDLLLHGSTLLSAMKFSESYELATCNLENTVNLIKDWNPSALDYSSNEESLFEVEAKTIDYFKS